MKIVITFLALMFAVQVIGQSRSMLSIGTTGNVNLRFELNGEKLSAQNRFITYQSINAGVYPLVIYQWNTSQGQWKEVFNDKVTITAGKHLEIVVLRFGKVVWDYADIEPDTWASVSNPGSIANTSGTAGAMVSPNDFKDIKNSISSEWNDEGKLQKAKVVMKYNLFSVPQIEELAKLFWNDDFKCSFLLFAFDYCAEKNKYFKLADLLWNSSNKKKLMDYLATR
jgi:hypothetical protein